MYCIQLCTLYTCFYLVNTTENPLSTAWEVPGLPGSGSGKRCPSQHPHLHPAASWLGNPAGHDGMWDFMFIESRDDEYQAGGWMNMKLCLFLSAL